MPVEIDMSLVMDNSKYVNPLKEAQKANQDFYNQDERNKKRELGLIEDIEQELKRLEDARKKAHTIEEIEKYNKKIQEGKKHLDEYSKAGLKTEEKTESLGQKFTRLAGIWTKVVAVAGTVWGALKIGQAVMESTASGADRLRSISTGLKNSFDFLKRSIYEMKFDGLIEGFFNAYKEGIKYQNVLNAIADKNIALQLREGDVRIAVEKLQKIYNDQNLTIEKRIDAIDKLLAVEKKYANDSKNVAQERFDTIILTAESETKLNAETIKFLLENYDLEVDKMQEVIDQRERMNQSLTGNELIKKNLKDLGLQVDENGKLIAGAVDNAIVFQEQLKSLGLITPKTKAALVDAWKTIQATQIQLEQATERATIRRANLLKEQSDNEKKTADDLLKKYQEYLKKLSELQDANREREIAMLSGEKQIDAQEQYEKELLDKLQAFLIQEYNLQVDSIEEIERAKELVTAESNKKRLELNKQYQDEAARNALEWLSQQEQYAQNELEIVGATEEEKLNLQIEFLKKRVALLNEQGDFMGGAIILQQIELLKKQIQSIWDSKSIADKMLAWMGLDDEQANAVKDAAKTLFDTISEIADQRVEDAERRVDITNDRIEEEQNALETEKELLEAGFAANVRAKQTEIDELKKLRDKQLRDEQAARKLQGILDTGEQVSNLITASSNIFRIFSKIPIVGIPLAIAMIGTMFGAFLKAKTAAVGVTRLAKGDSGVVKGKLHSEGGEPFLEHVEVEDGEAWGVLSRSATQKHGKEFHEIVKSFNKGDVKLRAKPNIKPIINISSDLSEKRLSSIEREMKKLNNHFANQGERTELPDKTIIRKPNYTRTIRKR